MNESEHIPGDAQIRLALHALLREKHADEPDTQIIDELGLCRGQVRVDVAVVNGMLHGYEIKSDRDSLRRLDTQSQFYGKVLDRATIVVGDRHITEISETVPEWWGVLKVFRSSKGIRINSVRRERTNPDRDPRSLVELLWLDEALDVLEKRGAARGVRGKPRRVVWDRVCQVFDGDEIAATVRAHLKARAAMRGSQPQS